MVGHEDVFLLSVALGIAGVILTAVLWMILSTMGVFSDIEGVLAVVQPTTTDPFSIKDYIGFGRVVSLSIVIGVIDVILMTALATRHGVPLQHLLGARRRRAAHADRRLSRHRPARTRPTQAAPALTGGGRFVEVRCIG